MAKITVNEKDLSWYYRQRQRGDLAVYVPGLASFGPYRPRYVTDTSLPGLFGGPLNVKNDYSYYLSKSLLKTGIEVLFQRVPLPGATQATASSAVSYEDSSETKRYVSLGVTKYSISNTFAGDYSVTITNKRTSEYKVSVKNDSDAALTVTVGTESYAFYGDGQTTSYPFASAEERDAVKDAVDAAIAAAADPTQYTATTEDVIAEDYTFEVDGETYTVPADGEPVEFKFTLEQKDAVDAAIADILNDADFVVVTAEEDTLKLTVDLTDEEGEVTDSMTIEFENSDEPVDYNIDNKFKDAFVAAVNANEYLTIESEEDSASVTINAKYEGEFGNQLSCYIQYAGPGIRYITTRITDTKGATYAAEYLTVNFIDPLSQYYYENVDSLYLEFVVDGDVGQFDTTLLNTGYVAFDGGLNFNVDDFDTNDSGEKITNVIEEAIYVMTHDKEDAEDSFFEPLKNPYGYYYDILTNGGLVINSKDSFREAVYTPTGEVQTPEGLDYTLDRTLVAIAENSKMSVYLVGGGRKNVMSAAEFKEYCGRFNSSFVSGIGPWGFSQLLSEGSRVWLPGWYAQLVEWGLSIQRGNPMWYAPAGTQRARVGSVVQRPDYEVGDTILDLWQNQDHTASNVGAFKVNPIMNLKQYGYCVYGNSTLLHSKFDGSTSMLQSLGTRIMVNRIKARAFDVALGLQFDQLTDNLFYRFKELMLDYMERLRYQGGLYDYQIILDRDSVTYADLNQRTVPVLIRISPNPAAENFDIMCEVYPAGITFTDEFDETSIIA